MKWVPGIKVIKDPNAVKKYRLDLRSDGWLATGDNVASYTIENVIGITIVSDTNDADSITVELSEGTVGAKAAITFRPVTDDGVSDDFTVRFLIKEQ